MPSKFRFYASDIGTVCGLLLILAAIAGMAGFMAMAILHTWGVF